MCLPWSVPSEKIGMAGTDTISCQRTVSSCLSNSSSSPIHPLPSHSTGCSAVDWWSDTTWTGGQIPVFIYSTHRVKSLAFRGTWMRPLWTISKDQNQLDSEVILSSAEQFASAQAFGKEGGKFLLLVPVGHCFLECQSLTSKNRS